MTSVFRHSIARRNFARPVLAYFLLFVVRTSAFAETEPLAAAYEQGVLPLLSRYCHDCHGADLAEAEIDFSVLNTWEAARQQPQMWVKVAEMIGNRLMPPEDAAQPSGAEREQLQRWLQGFLEVAAEAQAGDPGRVVLRRLNNAEYTYTIRDLTSVETLDPVREFPADGAAGEGFTNTGSALMMSPVLVSKYLDAAKEVAEHAVLLPDGFRFSPHTTRRDWTDDILAQIRAFYGEFTEASGGSEVNLQGIEFATNQGGRLPLEKYLGATLIEREALLAGEKSFDEVAGAHGLNRKYLELLWAQLTSTEPSLLLDKLREKWRRAQPEEADALASEIAEWQKSLWQFSTVGQIGRVGGPKRWMEAVDPLTTEQPIRYKFPDSISEEHVTISLVAADAGDGNEDDYVIWKAPRLTSPGQPDLLLRDVREVVREYHSNRRALFAKTAVYLRAAAELTEAAEPIDVATLAKKYDVGSPELQAWLDYLGLGPDQPVEIDGHFKSQIVNSGKREFVNGWGSAETPSLVANSSERHVRIPGNLKPHSVAVHPSPTLRSAVGWQSPLASTIRIECKVTHAHSECGNGVTWRLELRRGTSRLQLAGGTSHGKNGVAVGPFEDIAVRVGDVVALSIGPREGNHACDLTAIDIQIRSDMSDKQIVWDLAQDVSGDVLTGNPHADQLGNADVWHFYSEPDAPSSSNGEIPFGSLIAAWFTTPNPPDRKSLADKIQHLLTDGPPTDPNHPDAKLHRLLTSLRGPLLSRLRKAHSSPKPSESERPVPGLDLFGRHPQGRVLDPADLCVRAPSVLKFQLPTELVAGCEFVTTGVLDPEAGAEGSVQLRLVEGVPTPSADFADQHPVEVPTSNLVMADREPDPNLPFLVVDKSSKQRRLRTDLDEFRQMFPTALCYTKIVPVDEVIAITLFYREDDHLSRLMLNKSEKSRLDRLWEELRFVSREAIISVDAYEQLLEFATQDGDPTAFEPLRKPLYECAEAYRQQLVDSELRQLEALLDFAAQAYRRPLSDTETSDLRRMYNRLREEELSHEEAFRLTLARTLVAPQFLYRIERPVPGAGQGPVSDWELASRLSFFLWSSQPDNELRRLAASGRLHEPKLLHAQIGRMLSDDKVRRLATEFACQWLQVYDFETLDEKSPRHFPEFAELRGDMAEEVILFFTFLFQGDGSVLEILDADYTYLNEDLARHYGIPNIVGSEWRRVEEVRQYSRGGILSLAATLSKQSGASRTSPILRGNWIGEVLLGERLPKPPPGVPPLPEDEGATSELTVRQLVEKHVSDPKCAICHRRIDPYGFALEEFDAIGGHRSRDLGNRPVDTRVVAMDRVEFEGLDGLRNYLLTQRREAFVRQFCRKLLGYALGRSVQLSDEPLLAEMHEALAAGDYRVSVAIRKIVDSQQFREIRGIDSAFEME